MKVLTGGHVMGVLARISAWTSGNQAGMSKKGESPDCEYRRRLRSPKDAASDFHSMAVLTGGHAMGVLARISGMSIY